ncbi:uncharacterized protein VTP21DRAFT_3744 [Calcarisporiella thermophila]|uniref:uncharacterized protein n=1 Tax=Calcarisporiella thermophila TaxID=911321 RepID=UPI0037438295
MSKNEEYEEDVQMEVIQGNSEIPAEQVTINDLDSNINSLKAKIQFCIDEIADAEEKAVKGSSRDRAENLSLKDHFRNRLMNLQNELRLQIRQRNALKAKLTLEQSYEPPFEFVKQAFNTDYMDPHFAVERFIKYMLWCHKEWKRFSKKVVPFISLVQSSGYGKTRMISQIAKNVHVLYICKRNPGSTGFPSASPLIDWVLKTTGSGQ